MIFGQIKLKTYAFSTSDQDVQMPLETPLTPPDLLRFFKELNENGSIPENCKPISLDLKSMYTNIPIEEGIEAFRDS